MTRRTREGAVDKEGDESDRDPAWVARVREALLQWYATARRSLPWREERDPYRILVSEMMLVQTTVAAVLSYYERFLTRFPTVQALAAAEESEVVKAWEGLGYYRRARLLHAAAQTVVREHGGVFPDAPDALERLPGVGRYIAGAVRSFAFDQAAPIVEANTQRVLARWLAWKGEVRATATQKRFWEAAARLVPPVGAGVFNQAFMELGALICTPRSPSCLICPVVADCRARVLGIQDELPVVAPKALTLESSEVAALVVREGKVLVVQRGEGGLWEGFWEFPTVHVSGADPAGRGFTDGLVDLAEGVRRLSGIRVEIGKKVRSFSYSVTKHRVRLDAHEARGLTATTRPGGGVRAAVWVSPEDLSGFSFSSAGRKLIDCVVGRASGGVAEE